MLFDHFLKLLPPRPEILEVGPGTGQATTALVSREAIVTAVEPGARLGAILSSKQDATRLRIINSFIEDANLEKAAYDVVFAAAAYRWVAPDYRIEIPLRVLKRGGVFATIDLIQVQSPEDGGYFEQAARI